MTGRIRFICLFVFILVSIGTIVGCHDPCACDSITLFGDCCPPPRPCSAGEVRCEGECIPGVVCCYDLFNGGFIGACPESQSYCCPAGDCTTNFISCPDVTECPENKPQFCGPFCIQEDDFCCNEGETNIEPIWCANFTYPFCCNEQEDCTRSEECCIDPEGPNCGPPLDFGPTPAPFNF